MATAMSFDEASSSAWSSSARPSCPAYSALRGTLTRTHRDLALTRCTIACSYTERAHAAYAPNSAAANLASGGGAYEACRAEVTRWLGGDSCGCEVRVVHLGLPAQLTPLGSAFFLLAADGVRPLLQCDLPELRRAAATREERSGGGGGDGSSVEGTAEGAPPVAKVEDALWSSLPAARQRSLGGVALSLAGMLRAAAVQPTLFTLGATSLLVARELMQHLPDSSSSSSSSAAGAAGGGAAPTEGASTAPSRPTDDASLLIVDRTRDLVAPTMTNDHPLDRLLNAAHKADEGAARHKATLAASLVPPPRARRRRRRAATTASSAAAPPPPPRPSRPSLRRWRLLCALRSLRAWTCWTASSSLGAARRWRSNCSRFLLRLQTSTSRTTTTTTMTTTSRTGTVRARRAPRRLHTQPADEHRPAYTTRAAAERAPRVLGAASRA